MAKKEYDPVYLVISALGVGLGLSGGAASDKLLWGLIGGVIAGIIGCVVYYFIKRIRHPKRKKMAKDEFRMR